ncbi:MAG TPA: hypothetical protein VEL28_10875 [Candidatus Binatia bacterium]|nr:hypothetical protein [Candidatus Binatia bacterium]
MFTQNMKLGLTFFLFLVAIYGGSQVLFYETWREVSFVAVETDPVELIRGIPSYVTTQEFQRRLQEMGNPPQTVKDEQESEPYPNRPPFKHTFIDVEGFRHLEHTGRLTAHFFNERLAEVYFETPEIHEYYRKLLEQRGISSQEARELRHGNLVIRLALGPSGKPHVFLEDERLTDEMKLWIKRYS